MTTNDPRAAASARPDLENRLRALPKAPGPDPRFRDELRVQLLAAAERAPELSHADERTATAARSAAGRRVALPSNLPFRLPAFGRRAYTILGAAVAVLLVISGTTYWLAQRALPGDALYGLKRAGESVDLSTKQGDQSRGDAYLSISTTRIDEAAALVKRSSSAGVAGPSHVRTGYSASGPLSARVDGLVRDVLVAGDSAAVTATRLLTEASVSKRASHPAAIVESWLGDQRTKVKGLVSRLPETGITTAGGAARTLQSDLHSIQVRITALTAGLGCRQCKFSTSDRFGPLPCRVCPRPTHPTVPRRKPTRPRQPPGASTLPPSASSTLPSVLPTGTDPLSPTGISPTTGTGPTGTLPSLPPTSGVPPTGTSTPPPPATTSPTDGPTAPPTSTEPSNGSSSGSVDPTQAPAS